MRRARRYWERVGKLKEWKQGHDDGMCCTPLRIDPMFLIDDACEIPDDDVIAYMHGYLRGWTEMMNECNKEVRRQDEVSRHEQC